MSLETGLNKWGYFIPTSVGANKIRDLNTTKFCLIRAGVCNVPLDDDGMRIFFEKMFKAKLSDEELAELKNITNLTPGDFRTVRQEQFYLGDHQDNMSRIAALRQECEMKDGGRVAKIGFAT